MSDSEDNTTQSVEKEKKDDEKQEQPAEPVKRARRAIPKFEAEMLRDPQKGLAEIYGHFERMPESSFAGDKECLAYFMRKYQHWLYRLFPNDFGDMCWKIGGIKGVKNAVRDFVFEVKGMERMATIARHSSDDEEQEEPEEHHEQPQQQAEPPRDFLASDDEDEDDYPAPMGILDVVMPERQENPED